MPQIAEMVNKDIKHLRLLAKQYPSMQSICTEIINLRAILILPKGTEHFMSDLHGEHEAFTHILNNCSGVIREKVDELYKRFMEVGQREELCTLIYYPEEKLRQIKKRTADLGNWYEITLLQLIEVCKVIASKYTRSKVRKAMPREFAYIIDELLHADFDGANQSMYYEKIIESIIALQNADDFIVALASLIKRLAVDHLHIVGDIFDRGPRPDLIMDMLEKHHSVDIQWGNHDILWMGAAAGSEACIAGVVSNSAAFGNLKVLEEGYGINLRPLALFAEKTYRDSTGFRPRMVQQNSSEQADAVLSGKIHKAISIIMLKLEGQLWRRRPEYGMGSRLLLDRIDFDKGCVDLWGVTHPLTDTDLPTIDPHNPYALTEEEAQVVEALSSSFRHSERLGRHVRFLYAKGDMFKCHNQNLLFHGCVPMDEDGSFTQVEICGRKAGGRALMEWCEEVARSACFGAGEERQAALDAMWYFWCGKHSPLFGRDRMTTFERLFVEDPATWTEEKNPYYLHMQRKENCQRLLEEFGLGGDVSHIINGHVPVRASDGESPVKGGGKLIVIDGGFCKAYHPRTGIAGYTLIYNSYGLRLSAHKPFESTRKVIDNNVDIHSTTNVFETMSSRIRVMDTDIGESISEQIFDLSLLLSAYRKGLL